MDEDFENMNRLPIRFTFSDQAFALLGSEFPPSTYSLTSDQELEQWAIRETLPAI